jgi:hypothetical protein
MDRRTAQTFRITEASKLIISTRNDYGRRHKQVGPECLWFKARLLSRVITAVCDDALAEVGLKVSQFTVLNAVSSWEEMRHSGLAKFLEMDESTLSRNVARMCARG